MVDFSYDELNAASPPGYRELKNAAKAARDFACDLNSRYPGWASTGAIPGSPADTWTRAFWNDVCGGSPHPPPDQTKPFSGGQCPVAYNVTSQYTFKQSGIVSGQQGIVIGPLGGAVPDTSSGFFGYGIGGRDGNGNPKFYYFSPIYESAKRLGDEISGFAITSISRVDGLPDNCGDPPYQYPPDTYLPPPDSDRTVPYPNPAPSPNPNRKWSFTIPFFFIDANLKVNVDVGGLTFKFDIGKVSINLGNKNGDGSPGSFNGPDSNFPSDYAKQPDLIETKTAANDAKSAANSAKSSADGAKKAADDAARNAPDNPRNDPNQQDKTNKSEDDPKEETGINRLLFVDVILTSKPVNAKSQFGDGAPNVVYAGWFEFTSKGNALPRQPIHFDVSRFEAPVGADGFAYTVYGGFRARHVIITAKSTS